MTSLFLLILVFSLSNYSAVLGDFCQYYFSVFTTFYVFKGHGFAVFYLF